MKVNLRIQKDFMYKKKNRFNTQVLKLKGKEEITIKNRDKRRKRKRGALKDYLKISLVS